MISSYTKLIVLLGIPLGFTVAPAMHNEAFAVKRLDCFYFPIECSVDDLPVMLPAFRHKNFASFTVTKPLKVWIMRYLNKVSSLAEKMNLSTQLRSKRGKL